MARGGLVFVFFFGGCSGVGRVLTTGVVMRRRATSGEMARGLRRCCRLFRGRLREWGEVVDHRSGHAAPCHLRRDGTRGVGFCFFLGGCSGVGRVLTTGVVMRRRAISGEMARGGLVFVFFFGGCSGVGRVLTTGVVMRRRAISGEMARGGLVFVFFFGGCSGVGRVLTTGVVMRRRAISGEMARGGLVFVFFFGGCSGVGGGFFHRLGSGQTRMPPQSDGTRGFWFCGGALLPFVLRAVAGACVGRWTGQPRMPPRERLHEGFLVLWGGAVAVCSEGGCRSMCWPVDRPATHAAAGAAARGVLIFLVWGVLSHAREWSFGAVPSQERWHEGVG